MNTHRPKYYNPNILVDRHEANLPHWEQGEACIFVTFHLADSMPHAKLLQWQEERDEWLAVHRKPWTLQEQNEYSASFGTRLSKWLDQGFGSQILGQERIREVVWNALLHFDHDRYEMYAFVIMPTHVHALFGLLGDSRLEDVMQTWKSFSSKKINALMSREGTLWQKEYWDRLVRSREHFFHVVNYIRRNPGEAYVDVPVYVAPIVSSCTL